MKRLVMLLLCFVLLCPVLTVSAASAKIIDDANLLLYGEMALLEEQANAITEAYGMDVVILTVDSTNNTYIETFADDFYDNNGYGIGENASGVILVLAMDTREWAISTCGDAVYAITDYGIQELFSKMAWYLSEDDYYAGFDAYLQALPLYFDAYQQGAPIDGWSGDYVGPGSVHTGTREDTVYYEQDPPFILAPVIGIVLAGIVVLIMAGMMNTKKPQRSAENYLVPGTDSLHRSDIFLYSQIHKVRKQQQSSGGGGSSVHRSSGGRSHGGGHGRF